MKLSQTLPDKQIDEITSLEDITASKCEAHKTFFNKFLQIDVSRLEDNSLLIGLTGTGDMFARVITRTSVISIHFARLPTRRASISSIHPCMGRLVDPNWIDQGLLLQWKTICERTHGSVCLSPAASLLPNARPSWVIDVQQACLVSGGTVTSYVALSYVWGQRRFITTKKDSISKFQKPGAFAQNQKGADIPCTIRHAMFLTKLIGERYLWVDALCIVQDDSSQKHRDISRMASIYANSALTIIAAGGESAYDGLSGLLEVSGPRFTSTNTLKLGKYSKLVEVLDSDSYWHSKWRKRGWTYQEEYFSGRKLIFNGSRVRWECSTCTWEEDREPLPPPENSSTQLYALRRQFRLQCCVPDIAGLVVMIATISQREFTYAGDILPAFAGIASYFNYSFKDGFVSGIPFMFFDLALLWRPSLRSNRRNTPGACTPSWSWAGWTGATAPRVWNSLCAFHKRSERREAGRSALRADESLVQWSFKETLNSIPRPIECCLHTWRERLYNNMKTPCPPGWTRHAISCEPFTGSDYRSPLSPDQPACFYKHESEPDSTFWHPVPIPSKEDHMRPMTMAPWICCKTRRAWLYGESKGNSGMIKALLDRQGQLVGTVILHADFADSLDEKKNIELELVEIATGRCVDRRGLLHAPQGTSSCWPEQGGYYERYHVMSIEWKDGIAYRNGIGEVVKDLWEAQDREWVDLVLG